MNMLKERLAYMWERYSLIALLCIIALLLICATISIIVFIVEVPTWKVLGWFGFSGLVLALAINAWAIIDEIRTLKRLSRR